MVLVDIYPGELSWSDDVACKSGDPFEPSDGVLPDSTGSRLCFLNESRTRFAKYEIFGYTMSGYRDDGPPAIDQIVEACRIIDEALESKKTVVVFVPSGDKFVSHRAFSALCTAAHRVLMRGESGAAASEPWTDMNLGFLTHSWSSQKKPEPARGGPLSLRNCLDAIEFANKQGWIDIKTYEPLDFSRKWRKYDVSWVIPAEIQLAADFMTTVLDPDPATCKHLEHPVEDSYLGLFKAENVKYVVRMNLSTEPGLKKSYDVDFLKRNEITHLDLPYNDIGGGVPNKEVAEKLIATCGETAKGIVTTVHCKAGFGRSAVMAALLIVYRYNVSGELILPWLRICRPGSITTPQQARFLQSMTCRADVEKFIAPQACCALS